jgi:hypothetical protein
MPTARFVPSAELARNARLVNIWLVNAERPSSWLAARLRETTFADAVVMATDWREYVLRSAERRYARAVAADPSGAPAVLDEPSLGEGWSWVWLRSPTARETERKVMGHRLGRGGHEPFDPLMAILSLRDPSGVPYLTVQLAKTEVLSALHKGNRDASPFYAAVAARVAEIIGPRLLVQWNPANPIADGRHRRGDLVVHVRGGKLHREDGPALEWAYGTREWYRRGRRHRDGGPAVEHADGTKRWYRNGQLHRDDGPAIEWASSIKDWYLQGRKVSAEEVLAPSAAFRIP